MSSANRVRLIVAAVAVAAAGIVTGVVLATRQDPPQPVARCPQGARPLVVPGTPIRNVAAVRAAMAQGPRRAAQTLDVLAERFPKDPVVQFNDGTALFCAGFAADAAEAFRRAKKAGYDTFYEVQADVILHPQYFDQGYPPFVSDSRDPLLLQGSILQRQGHQHGAERVFARAARLHPNDAEAQVAAAVARFDMDDLSASFSRLGPLVRRFPQSQSVRFHLGLLLSWIGQRDKAVAEFRLARRLGPQTPLGKKAATFLGGLVTHGTKGTAR
jgi:tetratricopeptide (TPR) repeat protein